MRVPPCVEAVAGHQRRAAEPRREEVLVAKQPVRVRRATPRHVERLGEALRRAEALGGVPQHAV